MSCTSPIMLIAFGVVIGFFAGSRRFRLPRIALYLSLIVIALWVLVNVPAIIGAFNRIQDIYNFLGRLS
jgi:hypothetical protein